MYCTNFLPTFFGGQNTDDGASPPLMQNPTPCNLMLFPSVVKNRPNVMGENNKIKNATVQLYEPCSCPMRTSLTVGRALLPLVEKDHPRVPEIKSSSVDDDSKEHGELLQRHVTCVSVASELVAPAPAAALDAVPDPRTYGSRRSLGPPSPDLPKDPCSCPIGFVAVSRHHALQLHPHSSIHSSRHGLCPPRPRNSSWRRWSG